MAIGVIKRQNRRIWLNWHIVKAPERVISENIYGVWLLVAIAMLQAFSSEFSSMIKLIL